MPDAPICPIMSRPVPHMPNPDVEFHTGAVAWVPCIGSRCAAWIPCGVMPAESGSQCIGVCGMVPPGSETGGRQFADPAQPLAESTAP